MRHRDVRLTTETYGHLVADDLRGAVEQIAPMAGPHTGLRSTRLLPALRAAKDEGRDPPVSRTKSRPSESGRQDLNLRPLGPENFGRGSHRVVTIPTSPQDCGIPGGGKRGGSHPVTSDRPIPNGSFTFWAQNPELNFAFLTIREVAERLRVCRATVYRMIDKGQLRALRVSSGAIRVAGDATVGLQPSPSTPGRRGPARARPGG